MPLDELLFHQGLSLQAALPVALVDTVLPAFSQRYGQLLVFAHGGRKFWDNLPQPMTGQDPLDDHAIRLVEDFFKRIDCTDYRVLYPSTDFRIDLRSLGRQLGWHADSPLGIGINHTFGTWFAYRAIILANTSFDTTLGDPLASPCETCVDKPCIKACPVGAVGGSFNLKACLNERVRVDSSCALQCLARNVCPVGAGHRYGPDQMSYHYRASLTVIMRQRE